MQLRRLLVILSGLEKFTTKIQLQQYLSQARAGGKTIGLVPTMGALHQGHLSLIQLAQQQCDVVVCSIFVNPTQFNDPRDLEKYPRPIQEDIKKLEDIGCDILFEPAVNEIYDEHEQWHLDIGPLEGLLEGKYRPGHYQGVTQVVYKFFTLVKPDIAYFGQKDYQQFLIVKQMVKLLSLTVTLQMCPIKREPDGLAMSSRNIHLSVDDHNHALVLSKTLNHVSQNFNINNLAQLKQEAENTIKNMSGVELGYFEIADGGTLLPADENSKIIVALVAAKVGNTRLIDNMIIRS